MASRRVDNPYPQAEGYSYVNLVVVKTVGTQGRWMAQTRRAPREEPEFVERSLSLEPPMEAQRVVGEPGTETS